MTGKLESPGCLRRKQQDIQLIPSQDGRGQGEGGVANMRRYKNMQRCTKSPSLDGRGQGEGDVANMRRYKNMQRCTKSPSLDGRGQGEGGVKAACS
ncbi:MAG: hypothetical protein OEZ32_07390 [Nitrospinota bacterium]|nr:hypothetical protein [Nitrospinota bacterium]